MSVPSCVVCLVYICKEAALLRVHLPERDVILSPSAFWLTFGVVTLWGHTLDIKINLEIPTSDTASAVYSEVQRLWSFNEDMLSTLLTTVSNVLPMCFGTWSTYNAFNIGQYKNLKKTIKCKLETLGGAFWVTPLTSSVLCCVVMGWKSFKEMWRLKFWRRVTSVTTAHSR